MSTITTRSGKGSPLTNNEVDANFTNLNTDKLESADLTGYAELTGATFTGEVEATGFNGDLTGAILFKGQAGEALTKGDPVYISGISGNKTVVSKADANNASKMPCFGIVDATVSANADCSVVTFGTLKGLDTSSFSEGDELFVSNTGTLTTTAPTGESAQIQKIGKVTRSHASTGSIKVMGAGRTNAVPNLNDGQFFLGNGSNQAVSTDFTASVLGEISAGTGIGISGSGVISNSSPDQTVALTGAGATSISGTYPNFTITSTDTTYSLPLSSSSTRGGVKIGYSENGKNYPVELSSEKMFVNVPWTDSNTTYTAGSGLSLTGTQFSNTAPDQTVSLTGAGTTTVSGTYPNFTITGAGTTYTAGTGITLTGTEFSLTDTNAKLNLTGGTLTGALKVNGGSFSSGIDTSTVGIAIDRGDYIYSDDGSYLRRILGHTAGGAVEIGQGGTGLINQINLLPGTAGNYAVKVNGNTVWNAGNDGAGSGLDADLLDGQHGSYYYPASNPNGYTNDQTAAEILTAIKTVDGSGSGLDADTVDGLNSTQLYRRTGSASGTAGAGWVTVASNTSTRKHGEVIVSDSESGDHSFIRIDWMRSYADSAFTVINSGGHANRITAVRVLEQSSDPTYGTKYLQVYVTTSSNYLVRINTLGDVGGYSSHTAVTPVTQNTISGYAVDGSVALLDANNLASSQGIASGNGVFQGGTGDVDLKYYYNGSSYSGLKASISGAVTTAASGRLRFGSSSASYIQNGPGVSANLTIAANGGSSWFYGETNAATHTATIASQSRFNCGYGSVQDAYMCRAWGRFEMSGTHSFRDDEGFSSVTDISTGRSRLNFTNSMPNGFYSVNVTTGSSSYTASVCSASVYSLSTTQFYVSVEDLDSGFTDRDQMNVMVVR
jgi:hypothetical protein